MNPIRLFYGRARNARRASLLAGLTCACAALVAACSAGSVAAPPPTASPPAATATATPPPVATTPPTPPPAQATPATPPPQPTAAPTPPVPTTATLPAYQPSRVVSSGHGSAYLVSPDPVGKVSGFYAQVLSTDGWQLVSRNVSSHGAELVGRRQAQGARVQIFSAGHGSTILVASYGAALWLGRLRRCPGCWDGSGFPAGVWTGPGG